MKVIRNYLTNGETYILLEGTFEDFKQFRTYLSLISEPSEFAKILITSFSKDSHDSEDGWHRSIENHRGLIINPNFKEGRKEVIAIYEEFIKIMIEENEFKR